MPWCGASFRTTVAVAHGSIHIDSHIRSVEISLHGVIHTFLFEVTGKRWNMGKVEEVLSQGLRHKLL